jgi:hypothetical protein
MFSEKQRKFAEEESKLQEELRDVNCKIEVQQAAIDAATEELKKHEMESIFKDINLGMSNY